jgi:hypothetical protein
MATPRNPFGPDSPLTFPDRNANVSAIQPVVQMNEPNENRVSVTYRPTFWHTFFATFASLRHHRCLFWSLIIFPAGGLILFLRPYLMGHQPGFLDAVLALAGLALPSLLTALTVWRNRRHNSLARRSFTFSFDNEGIHVDATTFQHTLQWPLIHKMRESKRFLFIFISPTKATCIPLQVLRDQGVLEEVRDLAGRHTNFR